MWKTLDEIPARRDTFKKLTKTNVYSSLQTHHLDSTLKQRGNGRFHVVSKWCVCRDYCIGTIGRITTRIVCNELKASGQHLSFS